ncbi:MAG: ABC transporter permease, partial [Chloroflexi bacterium]|nr:ABC transporter permease [Chloroflexota bacterium]
MGNTWRVAWREFSVRVRSRGYLFSAVGTPLLLIVIWLATGALTSQSFEPQPAGPAEGAQLPIGLVDQAGLLGGLALPDGLELFAEEAQAREALLARRIDHYAVIAPDYRETGALRRVGRGFPGLDGDTGQVDRLLTLALLQDRPAEQAARLAQPIAPGGLEWVAPQGEDAHAPLEQFSMWPLIFASAVMVPLLTGGGWLLRSLSQEKESRVMEVLLVSVRPAQLLMGKLIGVGALIAVLYLVWGLVLWTVSSVARTPLAALLSGLNLQKIQLLPVLLFALGGFALYAALMAGLGALTPDVHSSQTMVFVITLPMLIPYYLWMPLTTDPQGAVALVLSLFPFSAPLAMVLRLSVASVPP